MSKHSLTTPLFTLVAALLALTLLTPASLQAQAASKVLDVQDDPYMGSPDAKVVLVEFADYQCGYCARAAHLTLPQIKEKYIDTGKVGYIFLDLPLPMHSNAFKAAQAAQCAADQGKFWQMHDLLFENMRNLGAEQLPGYAEQVGLDVAAFRQCLDGSASSDAVRQDMDEAQRLRIQGTPNFLVGRYNAEQGKVTVLRPVRGAQPYDVFEEALESVLTATE